MINYRAPHNEEAEEALLSCLIRKPDIIPLLQGITPDSFISHNSGKVYGAIKTLSDSGGTVDIVTVGEKAPQLSAYIAGLLDIDCITSNWSEYADLVKKYAALRKIADDAYSFYEKAQQEESNPSELSAEAAAAFSAIGEAVSRRSEGLLGDVAISERNAIAGSLHGDGLAIEESVYATGYRGLDENILGGGFRPGELVVIAARPSVGKTAIALNIAEDLSLNRGIPSIFFSLEMTSNSLYRRLICTRTGIEWDRIRRGMLFQEEREKVKMEMDVISSGKIIVDDHPSNTVADILAKSSRNIRQHAPDGRAVIFVDYLQFVYSERGMRHDNRVNEVAYITRGLKGISKQLGVPLVCLSQLSRAVEMRGDSKPRLSDLRDSGSIEQDADIVAMLSRDNEEDRESILLDICKNRNGPVGEIKMKFNSKITKFKEV